MKLKLSLVLLSVAVLTNVNASLAADPGDSKLEKDAKAVGTDLKKGAEDVGQETEKAVKTTAKGTDNAVKRGAKAVGSGCEENWRSNWFRFEKRR